MHRRTTWLAITLMVAAVGVLALQGCNGSTAADKPVAKIGMPAHKTMSCPMHGKMGKGQMKCTCPMHPMMMGKSIIATTDGGVVVMIGDKLMKFDRDLNLVKEAKIKMDFEGMEKKTDQPMEERQEHKSMMQKNCPMKKGPAK